MPLRHYSQYHHEAYDLLDFKGISERSKNMLYIQESANIWTYHANGQQCGWALDINK